MEDEVPTVACHFGAKESFLFFGPVLTLLQDCLLKVRIFDQSIAEYPKNVESVWGMNVSMCQTNQLYLSY